MNGNIAALLYLAAGVLFILALKGLSSPASSRAGNRNGMIGMALAIATTLWVAGVADGLTIALIVGGIGIGGLIGGVTAKKIAMTDMPQLVAAFHSLVGLAAVLTAAAALYSPDAFGIGMEGAIRTQSLVEMSLGVAIGAITFAGSLIAFAKLNGNMSGAPSAEPADLRCDRGADRLFHHGPAALGLLGHRRPELRLRHHLDHPHRRRRHAGGGVDAELLFGMGGGRHRLHPRKHR